MKQSEFDKVFSQKFSGFTSRMWLDYCDENNNPFAQTKDYAGYVIENLKYLVKRLTRRTDELIRHKRLLQTIRQSLDV